MSKIRSENATESTSGIPEDEDFTEDDATKVFVSRLPSKWTDDHLLRHFSSIFGPVRSAKVRRDRETEQSRGYGFVVFETIEARDKAVEQRSIHALRKTIMIRPIDRTDEGPASSRDDSEEAPPGLCYAWSEGRCTRGDACKFCHEGPGGCVEVAAPGCGKPPKCLEFKRKGRCKAGDACQYRHVAKSSKDPVGKTVSGGDPSVEGDTGGDSSSAGTSEVEMKEVKPKGVCHNWKKKNTCRKGDKCTYAHPRADDAGLKDANGPAKRRRVNGLALILASKSTLED